tara:strand:+ start:166 stop:378 length:213 start_codon:yes stop_codon:yes gene_type:complete
LYLHQLKPGKAVVPIEQEPGLALLAVAGDIHPGVGLLPHNFDYGALYLPGQLDFFVGLDVQIRLDNILER